MRWISLSETRFHPYHCRACCLGRSTSRLSTVEIPSCQQCSTEIRIVVTVVTSRLRSLTRSANSQLSAKRRWYATQAAHDELHRVVARISEAQEPGFVRVLRLYACSGS